MLNEVSNSLTEFLTENKSESKSKSNYCRYTNFFWLTLRHGHNNRPYLNKLTAKISMFSKLMYDLLLPPHIIGLNIPTE